MLLQTVESGPLSCQCWCSTWIICPPGARSFYSTFPELRGAISLVNLSGFWFADVLFASLPADNAKTFVTCRSSPALIHLTVDRQIADSYPTSSNLEPPSSIERSLFLQSLSSSDDCYACQWNLLLYRSNTGSGPQNMGPSRAWRMRTPA